MKKFSFKKGFTLIELLAVIVILAIILLIVMPIVLNVIKEARKGAFEAGANGLMKTVENEYYLNMLRANAGEQFYEFQDNELIVGELDFSGVPPESGVIHVQHNGEIALALFSNGWCAVKDYEATVITIIESELVDCIIEINEEVEYIATSAEYFDFNSSTGTIEGFY